MKSTTWARSTGRPPTATGHGGRREPVGRREGLGRVAAAADRAGRGGRNSRGEGPRSVRPGAAVSRAGWRPPLGEEGSQLAGGGDMGAWRRWQAGVQERSSKGGRVQWARRGASWQAGRTAAGPGANWPLDPARALRWIDQATSRNPCKGAGTVFGGDLNPPLADPPLGRRRPPDSGRAQGGPGGQWPERGEPGA